MFVMMEALQSAICEFPSLCLCFKASLSAKPFFDLHENEGAYRTHFHMKGFERRLVLKQKHKRTRNGLLSSRYLSQVIMRIKEQQISNQTNKKVTQEIYT